MRLIDYMEPGGVFLDIQAGDKQALLTELAERAVWLKEKIEAGELLELLLQREQAGSTGIGSGVAIPHAVVEGVEKTFCMVALLPSPIDFSAVDGEPVDFFFVVIAPPSEIGLHIRLLARIARMVKDEELHSAVRRAGDATELFELLRREDARHVE
jgi:PTS system nitrogen regulatory IIA component